ncbi:MAG: PHP domain-containing protein [Candidatus Thorarchaeota archaeon]|nr:PHP domain-containing protein [Candidatus Thorarchaeota archaeon]
MSPAGLVIRASEMELGALALTDHDTMDGLPSFIAAPAPEWLTRVPGVEMSTDHGNQEVHILGYYVPVFSPTLKKWLGEQQRSRAERFPKMVARLRDLGINIDASVLNRVLTGVKSPGRTHLARAVVEAGHAGSIDEVFDIYLEKGRPAYVDREKVTTEEAISILRRVGSVPVLAHPLQLDMEDLYAFMKEMKRHGLMGVETHYMYAPGEAKSQTNVESLAEELGLIQTGGSDFHEDNGHCGIGGMTVDAETVARLQNTARGLTRQLSNEG